MTKKSLLMQRISAISRHNKREVIVNRFYDFFDRASIDLGIMF
jgi:hypothetical protein